ncbi:dickkopf-related protein 2-like [Clinocottus analis]|uniref:dickkopf-related protein 2-like n=1 Tax=Clinocottus analis TaxID=304258 RepID=UPI0035BF921B
MTRVLVLMVCVALVLAARSRGSAAARIRLNSIRTVILREGHALPANTSTWEPSTDLTLHQCMSDLECTEGSYCHAPSQGPAHRRCHTCHRRKRCCHRDGMCCPGNRCSNNVCVPLQDVFALRPGWRRRGRAEVKGQAGDPCLRSPDCSPGLCCARHFWTRICKPVLQGGQVCTRHRRRKGTPGLELFQRCPCGAGLGCRTLQQPGARSSSSSSSMAAAESKFAASSSRRSSPHTTPPSSSPARSSSASKTRLHVCQKI